MHLETRPQAENHSAKPGCGLLSRFSLSFTPLYASSPSLALHAPSSTVGSSTPALGQHSAACLQAGPGGWVLRISMSRVRGSSSPASRARARASRARARHQEQRSIRRGLIGHALRGAQVSDSSIHLSSTRQCDEENRAAEANRPTPTGAGWRFHPLHQPVAWSLTQ